MIYIILSRLSVNISYLRVYNIKESQKQEEKYMVRKYNESKAGSAASHGKQKQTVATRIMPSHACIYLQYKPQGEFSKDINVR